MNTLFQQLAGESLQDSLAQLESRIRTQPGDADLRAAFAQLLCLDGNWTRAQAQLKAGRGSSRRHSRPSPCWSRRSKASVSVPTS